MQRLALFSLALSLSVSLSDGANILFLNPIGSKSHKIFYMGIVSALAERGHKVTILSAYKNSKEIKNVVDVAVPELDIMGILTNVFEEGGAGNVIKDLVIDSPRICNEGMALKRVQELKIEKYDVILLSMFFSYCYYSFIHHFKVPLIFLSPAALVGPFAELVGSVDFPSLSQNKLLEASYPFSFNDRLWTIGLNTLLSNIGKYYLYPKSGEICKEMGLCPSDMPSFDDFAQNASLAIVNSIRSLEIPPRPSMANVIYAGGAHIKPANPLSNELEKWIQGSGEHGFIFLSLGSGFKPSDMPEKHRKALANVFGSLSQRVLWKWDEETMADLPSNVKLSKWFPQQDILAHNKLRLFITHGGLLSTMEATYHGVPCLGMPIFGDQFSNMKEAASEGWARILHWKDLNEKSLTSIINEIIFNVSLKETSLKRSLLMKDVPIHPADEAAFWVEFVIRHGGANHLKSPLFQMSWYELYNVDVWAAIIFSLNLILFVIYRIIKALFRICFAKRKRNLKNKVKNKRE